MINLVFQPLALVEIEVEQGHWGRWLKSCQVLHKIVRKLEGNEADFLPPRISVSPYGTIYADTMYVCVLLGVRWEVLDSEDIEDRVRFSDHSAFAFRLEPPWRDVFTGKGTPPPSMVSPDDFVTEIAALQRRRRR